jgi:nucleoside-diphosphate-sugar epimerase
MNVLVVGGTGFLGYHAVRALHRRGDQVTVFALDLPVPDLLPDGVRLVLGDLNTISDDEALKLLSGHDALVFCAGVDDRHLPKAPAWDYFHRYNVLATKRWFSLARQAGVRRGVVCGSYFAWFHRTRPEWDLAGRNPYIRSRVVQAEQAIEAGGDSLAVCILELPYIFGSMPGRKPLWTPLIQYLRSPWPLFYTKGGTGMVSVHTVGAAIVGALDRGQHGQHYVIGDENRSWPELLEPLSALAGRPKKVRTVPTFLVTMALWVVHLLHRLQGKESGLYLPAFGAVQTSNTFFDPAPAQQALGFSGGDLDQALRETVDGVG